MARTYLVVSTSAVRKGVDRPELEQQFEPDSALERLADELSSAYLAGDRQPVPVTLKVHGFNIRRSAFEREVLTDADPRLHYTLGGERAPAAFDSELETFRPDNRFYLGFRWSSEGMFTKGSLRDTLVATCLTPMVGALLVLLPLVALIVAGYPSTFLLPCVPGWTYLLEHVRGWGSSAWQSLAHVAPWAASLVQLLATPYRDATLAAGLLGAGVLLLTLRLSTYNRDRYRALHYGVPDLGEFMRCLEQELVARDVVVQLDVVGHSMGSLVLINAFRVMSDYFRPPDDPVFGALGRFGTFRLRSLILCAPDLPAVMATPDNNNYFLSALRRFQSLHVFCSDRDIVLKWLSVLANWTSEPRHDMAGRKLGNVLLVRARPARLGHPDSRTDWSLVPVTRPVVRDFPVYPRDPLKSARPAELHFHDCTRQPSLAGTDAYCLVCTVVILGALFGLRRLWCPPVADWALAVTTVLLGGGMLCRLLWPFLRDRGVIGGLCGFLADTPTVTMLLTPRAGWNPHSGYFMLGQPPRRRIAALLEDPALYPPRTPDGTALDEEDGPIRYRRVLVSV